MLHPILHPVIEQRLTFNCVGKLTFPKFILVLNMTTQKPTLLITLNKKNPSLAKLSDQVEIVTSVEETFLSYFA